MTLKLKIAICLLTTVCLAMTIMVFDTLSIASGTEVSTYVASSNDVITGNLEMMNLSFFASVFTPVKIISAFVACFSILLIILTYGVYGKTLRKSNFSTYIPLAVWAISFLVIYINQPSAPWQVWIGLFVLCSSAYILTILDEKAYQESH